MRSALIEMALKGRHDGHDQQRSKVDCMTVRPWKISEAEWSAYLAAFYRGAGFLGSGNRHQRTRVERRMRARTELSNAEVK